MNSVITLKSRVLPDITWKIKSPDYFITEKDREYIKNLNPVVYSNDLTGESWAFDIKLPTGRWLEHIVYKNGSLNAFVLF